MNVEALYEKLLEPSADLVRDITLLDGDIIILGVGGKMGPALAMLAQGAIEKAGISKKVTGVARFTSSDVEDELRSRGIETIRADLLDERALQQLPEVPNVLYLAGMKFGTHGNESLTWAMNSYLPGRIAEHYKNSRIVAFSTGNVYPLMPVNSGGAKESDYPGPVGEYAQSCLGRERVFQYFSQKNNTPMLIYRLNYANDVTYGVLVEIAKSVLEERPVDVSMAHVNVIWQGEANEIAIRCLLHCDVPPRILNVTGSETLSVRKLAEGFGSIFKKAPVFSGSEEPTALLSNASENSRLFGPQKISLSQMMELIAAWLQTGGRLLDKPTHFSERTGRY